MSASANIDSSTLADQQAVAALDTEYQAAVQRNDMAAMDRLLADDFVLITGAGRVISKADLLEDARSGNVIYERQDDSQQVVRVWGDTAVITALLWVKGAEKGAPFEYKLWFSDVYLRSEGGWKYTFAQASARVAA